MISPIRPHAPDVSAPAGQRLRAEAHIEEPLCPDSMTVGTDDVALRDLGHQLFIRHEHGAPGHEIEQLGRWVSMIEVHLVRFKPSAAVGTRNVAKLAQHLEIARLTDADPV